LRSWRGFQFFLERQVQQPGLLFHFGQQFLVVRFVPLGGQLAGEGIFKE